MAVCLPGPPAPSFRSPRYTTSRCSHEIPLHTLVKRRLTILGSTGSVGLQALDVVRAHPDRFEIVGLAAGRSAAALREQAREFSPEFVALENGNAADVDGLVGGRGAGAGA